ncbi:MAG TPA: hypothetical protein VJ499_00215 [Flavisolibacter sp.]|nr:hypothetical protein [Flavisolibacter sp.]
MNINNKQTAQNEPQCCIDYCRTIINMSGQEVVNNYKCDQQPFSTSDLWRIRRKKKEVSIRTSIY